MEFWPENLAGSHGHPVSPDLWSMVQKVCSENPHPMAEDSCLGNLLPLQVQVENLARILALSHHPTSFLVVGSRNGDCKTSEIPLGEKEDN